MPEMVEMAVWPLEEKNIFLWEDHMVEMAEKVPILFLKLMKG